MPFGSNNSWLTFFFFFFNSQDNKEFKLNVSVISELYGGKFFLMGETSRVYHLPLATGHSLNSSSTKMDKVAT